ncbi:MAG TPA: hypothetical protein VIY68_18535 [Steroidobacteraceae bacterium]
MGPITRNLASISYLLLAVAILHDYRAHNHVHRVYWIAASTFVVVHLGVMWAFGSPAAWMMFAHWITQT